MKHQALFSSKGKSKKKLKCCLLQFLFGALRVNKGKLGKGAFKWTTLVICIFHMTPQKTYSVGFCLVPFTGLILLY